MPNQQDLQRKQEVIIFLAVERSQHNHQEVFSVVMGLSLNSQHQREVLVFLVSSQHLYQEIFLAQEINKQKLQKDFSCQELRQHKQVQEAVFLGVLNQASQHHKQQVLVLSVEVGPNPNSQLHLHQVLVFKVLLNQPSQHHRQLAPVSTELAINQVQQLQPALLKLLHQ